MDNSKTPSNSRPSSYSEDGDYDFLASFQNLNFQDYGVSEDQATSFSTSNNHGAAAVSSTPSSSLPQTQTSDLGFNQWSQFPNPNFLPNYTSYNGGSLVGSRNWTDNDLNHGATQGTTMINTGNGYNQDWYMGSNLTFQNQYPSNGVFSDYPKNTYGDLSSSISLHNHQYGNNGGKVLGPSLEGIDIMSMAMVKENSKLLQSVLQLGNRKVRTIILLGVLDHLPQLIKDHYGQHMFRQLVESCDERELETILEKFSSQSKSFVEAVYDMNGSKSIQNLVRRLKKSQLGCYLTAILAPNVVDMAKSKTARHVLKECLSLLGYQANKCLFKEAKENFKILAKHEVGCLALNDCIDNMNISEERDKLLQLVADSAVSFSFDPSGNFVVQHVVSLKHPVYSVEICKQLKGHYVHLSTKKFGSHVVEKCIESCDEGMEYVIEEILEKAKALELARHQYGNYVIQKAIEITQKSTHVKAFGLCHSLVMALQPDLSSLERSRTSKKLVEKIKNIQFWLQFSAWRNLQKSG